MPMAKLTTNRAIDAIPNPKQGQVLYWCTNLRGFGIRIGARDKVFVLQRRVDGMDRRITIGRYGEITLQKARQDAEQLIGEMSGGTDPVQRKKDATAGGLTLREAWVIYQQTMKAKGRSQATFDDYQYKIKCHMSDWLDRPLVEITRKVASERHAKIGAESPYMANGCMRVLRAIWRRARREHPALPESPTVNVDFYQETPRDVVIKDWPAWWSGVQQITNPVRRDFYIWLAFSGCRAGETMRMAVADVDLDNGIVCFPITKTEPFEMPISTFMADLLRKRIAGNAEMFGADCQWVFPSITSESGHLEEEKLVATELKLFRQHWSPHVLRHSWITNANEKVKVSDLHQRALTNHAPKKSSDTHSNYIHVDTEDLRESQQRMTDYLLAQIKPKPGPAKNVVAFKRA